MAKRICEVVGTEILVCHAGSCLARGAEAVLTEIEELVQQVGGNCVVRPSACLGLCSQAPNAVTRVCGIGANIGEINQYVMLRNVEACAKVVERTTGKTPNLDNPATQERLALARESRIRLYAIEACKWNVALRGLAERAMANPALALQRKDLLARAGFPEGIVVGSNPGTIEIDNYSRWSVESITPVTRHSALVRLKSNSLKRGTPHPRGGGRTVNPITWHTTMLAEVGPNAEGPLPWVERDYTPISSASEWEDGRCDMIIKFYANGAATSWLLRTKPQQVWLSKPAKTLKVPALVSEGEGFQPASVLLLLAGTGVVALPQILAHRDPIRQLRISTPLRNRLCVPIDLVLSCREDDVLLLPQIAQLCREGGEISGVRSATILLTPGLETHLAPFPDTCTGNAAEAESELKNLPNAKIIRSRISTEMVAEAIAQLPQPCRVLVSGPEEFNGEVRRMLTELLDVDAQVTVLSAKS